MIKKNPNLTNKATSHKNKANPKNGRMENGKQPESFLISVDAKSTRPETYPMLYICRNT